jgi:hypothetical protein
MERICKFYKETSGEWFIDLPEWEEDKSALQMVLGADTLLDIMAQGHNEVLVRFSTDGFPGADVMGWVTDGVPGDIEMSGATYHAELYRGIEYNLDLWLCNVTLFVLGEFPKYIYYSCLTEV